MSSLAVPKDMLPMHGTLPQHLLRVFSQSSVPCMCCTCMERCRKICSGYVKSSVPMSPLKSCIYIDTALDKYRVLASQLSSSHEKRVNSQVPEAFLFSWVSRPGVLPAGHAQRSRLGRRRRGGAGDCSSCSGSSQREPRANRLRQLVPCASAAGVLTSPLWELCM